MGQIWEMFSDLINAGERQLVSEYDEYTHTLDIIKAAMSGNVSNESFNLDAYETQCALNDKKDFYNKLDKVLYIVDTSTGTESEDLRVGYGEISANKLKSKEDPYEGIEDMEAFETNISILIGIRSTYLATKGIDIVELLRNSLKGIPEAVSTLRNLVQKDTSNISELLSSLLESGDALSMKLEMI